MTTRISRSRHSPLKPWRRSVPKRAGVGAPSAQNVLREPVLQMERRVHPEGDVGLQLRFLSQQPRDDLVPYNLLVDGVRFYVLVVEVLRGRSGSAWRRQGVRNRVRR